MPSRQSKERGDELGFLHRVRQLLGGHAHPIIALTDPILAPIRASNRSFRLLVEFFPSKETLTEDLLAEIDARLEELAPETPGLKPLPEMKAKEWDEIFEHLQHRYKTELWGYDTIVHRWLDEQGLAAAALRRRQDTVCPVAK
jgi:hypothetical protein